MSSSDVATKPFSRNSLAAASTISCQRLGRATWGLLLSGVVPEYLDGRTVGWLCGGHVGRPQFGYELIAQAELLHLRRRHRPLGDDAHVARHLEAGHRPSAEGDDLRLGHRTPGLELQ